MPRERPSLSFVEPSPDDELFQLTRSTLREIIQDAVTNALTLCEDDVPESVLEELVEECETWSLVLLGKIPPF